MKCPYRADVRYLKPETSTFNTGTGKIKITLIEHTEYADCYGTDCPFYDETDGVCLRIRAEIGEQL